MHICFQCSEKLCDTHTFKQKCIASIKILNEIKAIHLENTLKVERYQSDEYDSEDNAPLHTFVNKHLSFIFEFVSGDIYFLYKHKFQLKCLYLIL